MDDILKSIVNQLEAEEVIKNLRQEINEKQRIVNKLYYRFYCTNCQDFCPRHHIHKCKEKECNKRVCNVCVRCSLHYKL